METSNVAQLRIRAARANAGACAPCALTGEHAEEPPPVKISEQTPIAATLDTTAEPDPVIGFATTPLDSAPNGEHAPPPVPTNDSSPAPEPTIG